MVFDDVPSLEVAYAQFEGIGVPMADVALQASLVTSKGEAARLVSQGGLYANDRRITEGANRLTLDDAIGGRVIVLRKGQRERRVIKLVR